MRVQQTEHEPPSKVLPWLYSQNLKWDVFVPVLGSIAVALVLVVLVKSLLLVWFANLEGKEFLPCLAGLLPNADLVFLPVHIDRATPLGSIGVCIVFAECGSAIGVVVWHGVGWLLLVKAHIAFTKFKRDSSPSTGSCKPYIQRIRTIIIPFDYKKQIRIHFDCP